MENVTRYVASGCLRVSPAEDGGLVSYDDYTVLYALFKTMERELVEAHAQLLKIKEEQERWKESSTKMTAMYEHRGKLLER
jgi:hypothetical protein